VFHVFVLSNININERTLLNEEKTEGNIEANSNENHNNNQNVNEINADINIELFCLQKDNEWIKEKIFSYEENNRKLINENKELKVKLEEQNIILRDFENEMKQIKDLIIKNFKNKDKDRDKEKNQTKNTNEETKENKAHKPEIKKITPVQIPIPIKEIENIQNSAKSQPKIITSNSSNANAPAKIFIPKLDNLKGSKNKEVIIKNNEDNQNIISGKDKQFYFFIR
jgi:hypothetical protein